LGKTRPDRFTGTVANDHRIELATANGVRLRGPLIVKRTEFGYDRHMLLSIEGGPDNGVTVDFTFQETY
jgi:hypothetical protein